MSVYVRKSNLMFFAPQDITCFIKGEKNQYISGEALVGDASIRYDEFAEYNNMHKDIIDQGFVTAFMYCPKTYGDEVVYRCTVKAGVQFFVGDNLKEISAREIIIEREADFVDIDEFDDLVKAWPQGLYNYFGRKCFDEGSNGIIGFLCLDGGQVVNPTTFYGNKSNVVGVVCDEHDGVAIVAALDEVSLAWCTLEPDKCRILTKTCTKHKKLAYTDPNGYENCKNVRKSRKYNPEIYPAITHCIKYSKGSYKEGRWFMGSANDIISMIRENMFIINLTLLALKKWGVECDLLHDGQYWTSTEFHEVSAWMVTAETGFFGYNVKSARCAVRPITIFNLN